MKQGPASIEWYIANSGFLGLKTHISFVKENKNASLSDLISPSDSQEIEEYPPAK